LQDIDEIVVNYPSISEVMKDLQGVVISDVLISFYFVRNG
jgi:hypothetical protein